VCVCSFSSTLSLSSNCIEICESIRFALLHEKRKRERYSRYTDGTRGAAIMNPSADDPDDLVRKKIDLNHITKMSKTDVEREHRCTASLQATRCMCPTPLPSAPIVAMARGCCKTMINCPFEWKYPIAFGQVGDREPSLSRTIPLPIQVTRAILDHRMVSTAGSTTVPAIHKMLCRHNLRFRRRTKTRTSPRSTIKVKFNSSLSIRKCRVAASQCADRWFV
jgi:hypothetical protein